MPSTLRENSAEEKAPARLRRIRFPFKCIDSGCFGRYTGLLSDSGIACVLDLRGESRVVAAFETVEDAECLSVNGTGVAVGGSWFSGVFDINRSERTCDIGRAACSIEWVNESVVACGEWTGSVSLFDVRSDTFLSGSSGVPLRTGMLRSNRFQDCALASVHGDVVQIWDSRQMRSPVHTVNPAYRSEISSAVWISGSEMSVVTAEGMFRVTEGFSEIVDPNIRGGPMVTELPRKLNGLVLVPSVQEGLLRILDPFTGEEVYVVQGKVDSPVTKIGYLEETLVCQTGEGLNLVPLGEVCSFWGSGCLQAVPSQVSFTAEQPSPAIVGSVELLGRRLGRMFLHVDSLITAEVVSMEVTVCSPEARVKLVVNLSVNCQNISLSSVETWWVRQEADIDQQLPRSDEFFPSLPLNFWENVASGEHVNVLEMFANLKAGVARLEAELTGRVEEVEEGKDMCPFPPTCGVCWSPRGDLYRFHSLKGLFPYSPNRPKLTMTNFEKLAQITESGDGEFPFNRLSPFEEPMVAVTDDAALVAEFNQRIVPDQCVQFLPSAVFETRVEDHYFATIAPLVEFSNKSGLRLLAEASRKVGSCAAEAYDLAAEFISDKFCSSGLDVVRRKVLEETVCELYTKEQTQAVAVIATHARFLDSWMVRLLQHDHASFFQQLQCWQSARYIEKILAGVAELPLVKGREEMTISGNRPNCSVCEFPVHGLGTFCPECGHGGHLNHVDSLTECAVSGCDCACWTPNTSIVANVLT